MLPGNTSPRRPGPKLHPLSVRNVLVKAGLPQTKYYASGRVRGWGHSHEGFKIVVEYGKRNIWRQSRSDRRYGRPGYLAQVNDTSAVKGISVEWVFGDWFRSDHDAEWQRRFAEIVAALAAAGYTVEATEEPRYL